MMDYSLKEINKILYGDTIGPCERKHRRKLRRLRSKSSHSGPSRVARRSGHRASHRGGAHRPRLFTGCCRLRHGGSGTIAGSMCLSFPSHRSRMRRSTVAPVTTSVREVVGRTSTGSAAAGRGAPRRTSAGRTPGAVAAAYTSAGRGRVAPQTRPVRRTSRTQHTEPVRGSVTVRQQTRASRVRRRRARQQQRPRQEERGSDTVEPPTREARAVEKQKNEGDMKSAATCKPSTAGATLTPPGTATARTTTTGGGGGGGGAAGDPASLEARIAAFKADPALMEVATRFVTEVLERAKEEASKRLRERDGAAPQETTASDVARGGLRLRGLRGRSARWGARAQNFLVRIFASLCLCNSTGSGGVSASGGGGSATESTAAAGGDTKVS